MKASITTPVARLVLGSVHVRNDKAMDGSPLKNKEGKLYTNYWFNIAIPKGKETSWKETDWGKKIVAVAKSEFHNGQSDRKSFSWKIIDGDSEEVPEKSTSGKAPCKWEGYPGNWIMCLKTTLDFEIYNRTGKEKLNGDQVVNLGDWIQVNLEVSKNDGATPGVYLSPKVIAFSAYGDRIVSDIDPSQCGFGESPLPAGASETPNTFLEGR